jgi:hypothetical protein
MRTTFCICVDFLLQVGRMLDGIQYSAFSRRQGISRVSAADVACVVTALLVTPLRPAATPAPGSRSCAPLFLLFVCEFDMH